MFQLLLVIIYISFISLGLPDSLLGSAWPSMYQEFQVPIAYAGIVSMIIAGCTIISSLFSDRLVRKLGTGPLTAVSVGMTAVALMGFSFAGTFPTLCLWAIPYGLGAGSVDAVLNNYVALHYKARHMSWLHCFWGVGASMGPAIMGACLTGHGGFSSGYRTVSLIQITLTAVLFLSLPLWKQKNVSAQAEDVSTAPLKIRQMLSLPGAKTVLLAFFCYCSLEQVTGLWGSSFLVLKKGLAPETAASLISLFYLGITAGRFLGGLLAMKLSSRLMIRLGQGFAAAGAILLLFVSSQFFLSLGFMLVGLGCAPIYPSLLHQTPERFGKAASQSMMGLQMACAYVGTTFSPPLIGTVVENSGTFIYPLFLLLFVSIMVFAVEKCNHTISVKKSEVLI